jgi:hypothetical protein
MEPLAGLQALATAFGLYEKISKAYKEWTSKLPDNTPAKQEATKDLAHVEEALQLAKVELAKGFNYPLCQRHFPPGIKLDIRENKFPRWKCSTCGDISPKPSDTQDRPREASWVKRT